MSIINSLTNLKNRLPKEFIRFLSSIAVFGFSVSIMNTIFNNFLNEEFTIGDFQRGILELPREMPGFLVVFVAALFFFLSTRRLAAFSHLFAAIGIFLVGHFSTSYGVMLMWLFIFSLGQHMFVVLNQSIGMEFAHDGKTGRRLGQIAGANNFAGILGSFVIFIGFKYFGFNFSISFTIAAAGLVLSSIILFTMTPDEAYKPDSKFTFRKEYKLYYWLNVLYGTRKQLFITFAPWVLVTVFHKDTATLATLYTIGGVIGIAFNPLLGMAIDKLGERFILVSEAVILIVICLAYAFAKSIFPENIAFIIASACFIIDNLAMSVGMARSTYIKKIAVKPSDVAQTLSMGVSIDHFFSIIIAFVAGYVWMKLGFQYVFVIGALIAVINLFSASKIKLKKA